jgi:hypothetical protein
MAWGNRNVRLWWRGIGLGARPSPARVSEWLERHAGDPGLAAERAGASIVLGRTARARVAIELLEEGTAAERWTKARLLALAAMVDGSPQPAVQDLRRSVEELDEPQLRISAEAYLISFEVAEVVAAGGDWKRELRVAVDGVNQAMVSRGLGEWRFRLRTYDRVAYAAAALTLVMLGGLLIAVVVTAS